MEHLLVALLDRENWNNSSTRNTKIMKKLKSWEIISKLEKN